MLHAMLGIYMTGTSVTSRQRSPAAPTHARISRDLAWIPHTILIGGLGNFRRRDLSRVCAKTRSTGCCDDCVTIGRKLKNRWKLKSLWVPCAHDTVSSRRQQKPDWNSSFLLQCMCSNCLQYLYPNMCLK